MRLLRSRAQKKHPRHGPGQASAEPRGLSLRPSAPTCITLPRPDSMAGNPWVTGDWLERCHGISKFVSITGPFFKGNPWFGVAWCLSFFFLQNHPAPLNEPRAAASTGQVDLRDSPKCLGEWSETMDWCQPQVNKLRYSLKLDGVPGALFMDSFYLGVTLQVNEPGCIDLLLTFLVSFWFWCTSLVSVQLGLQSLALNYILID